MMDGRLPNRVVKIEPDSQAEEYLIELFSKAGVHGVRCRLGAIFGKPYNEYEMLEEDYQKIREYLKTH